MAGVFVIVAFTVLFALRVPASMSMLGAAIAGIWFFLGTPMLAAPQYIIIGMSSFELLAIPFFVLAAEIMNAGGITRRLFAFALACVGWARGGLAQVTVLASLLFAGVCGSAAGDAAAVGKVNIKAMREAGYPLPFSAAVTVSASLIGALIPPSVALIVYALVAEVSVGAMLLAGVVPGLLLALLLMSFIYGSALSGRVLLPVQPFPGFKRLLRELVVGAPAIFAPVVLLAALVGGVMTVTEAGVVACLYSLLVAGLIYRELDWRAMGGVLSRTVLTSAMLMFLIGTSNVVSWIVTWDQVGAHAAHWLVELSDSRFVQLLLLNLLLLVIGMALEGVPALLILVPVLAPMTAEIGLDPIQLGIILVYNLLVGTVTPPMGICVFIVSSIAELKVETVFRACMPFLIPLLLLLGLITYVPAITLWLPNLVLN